MKHFIFLVYSISFLSGMFNLMMMRLIYLKERISWLKNYMICLSALTALVLAQTVVSYNLVNGVDARVLAVLLNIISYVTTAIMIYEIPKWIYHLIEKEWLKGKVFGALSVLQIIYLGMYYITPYKLIINFIASGSLFGALLYSSVVLVRHYKAVICLVDQKKIIYFILATIIYLPYMYLDTKTEQIAWLKEYFPYGLLSLPLYYLACNMISIYFEMRYIRANMLGKEDVEKSMESMEKEETDSNMNQRIDEWRVFYDKYHITKREKEIIELLIKGESYTDIAQTLMISVTTVKTHIHHIYQKTGVKNKIQLIQLAKDGI